MFLIFLILCLLGATLHSLLGKSRSRERTAELFAVYMLAGYCGIAQILFAAALVFAPAEWQMAHLPEVQPGNPVMAWFACLILGLGTIATMTIRHRGAFLAAPLIAWAIFWTGATFAHSIHDHSDAHPLTAHSFLGVFVTHGLVALILIVSGGVLWRARHRSEAA